MVEENFGESELAKRFGVQRYPAVFVNDVLVAKPKDFGFFGSGGSQGQGRYTPWLNAENQGRFRADMSRIVGQAVRGELSSVAAVKVDAGASLQSMPTFEVEDIDGTRVATSDLLGTVTVIEFWATWCPPCIKALPTLRRLQLAYEDDVIFIGIAVESKESAVRGVVEHYELPFPNVLGTPELARAFGDLVAVPTMFVFARDGSLAKVFYGAPPGQDKELEKLLESLVARGDGR